MSDKKPKQEKLPSFTEIDDDIVEELAQTFADERDAWQEKGKDMAKAKKALLEGAKKNKNILEAAKKHPKGKVKVGDALLTIKAKNPTLDIKVKMFGEASEEEVETEESPEASAPEAAE